MDTTNDSTGTITLQSSTKDEQMERVKSGLFDIERVVTRADDDNAFVKALVEFDIVSAKPGKFEHVMEGNEFNMYVVDKAFALATGGEDKNKQFSVHYAMAFDLENKKLMTDQLEIANYIDQTDWDE